MLCIKFWAEYNDRHNVYMSMTSPIELTVRSDIVFYDEFCFWTSKQSSARWSLELIVWKPLHTLPFLV